MRTAKNLRVVLVTAPNLKSARALAQGALESQLVACANLIPGIESRYRWKGKIETSSEVLILFKTTKPKLTPLEKFVAEQHPYDTPEFLVLQIESGAAEYLQWVQHCVA